MSMDAVRDRPYGIYVHIPFCKAKCKYCAFVSTPDLSLQKSYVNALTSEIRNSNLRGSTADTVYVGGGTPSCLYKGALTEIFNALHECFSISKNAEITVECNPESVNESFIAECKSSGVNRISMGLQSSDDKILKNIGRLHSFDRFMTALMLLDKSFDNISTDLIIGLPNQTAGDFDCALNAVSDICSHISVYALTVEEGTPLYGSGYAPDDDITADLYDYVYKKLTANNFSRYEVSNFAREGKQSRHNKKYWECLPYIGFGAAAHGYDGVYTRYVHSDDIAEYIKNPSADILALTEKDLFNEYVMLRLRTEDGISVDKFYGRFGYYIKEIKGDVIARFKEKGYLAEKDGRIYISPKYMFVMNGIIEDLMLD